MLIITSGLYKGRKIVQPNTVATRPISEKTRHAVFQVLGELSGLRVLDLYAGSGAMGLEALSLEAQFATFVDSARVATSSIEQSIGSLGVADRCKVLTTAAEPFLQTCQDTFDVVFFDPPYLAFDLTLAKRAAKLLTKSGVLVVSCSAKTKFLVDSYLELELLKQKVYGDTQILYFGIAKDT